VDYDALASRLPTLSNTLQPCSSEQVHVRRNVEVGLLRLITPITAITAVTFLAYTIELRDVAPPLLLMAVLALTLMVFRTAVNSAVPTGELTLFEGCFFGHATVLLASAVGFAVASVIARGGNVAFAQTIDLAVGWTLAAVVGASAIGVTVFACCFHVVRGEDKNLERAQRNAITASYAGATDYYLMRIREGDPNYQRRYRASCYEIRQQLQLLLQQPIVYNFSA